MGKPPPPPPPVTHHNRRSSKDNVTKHAGRFFELVLNFL